MQALFLLSIFLAVSHAEKPTFSWLENRASEAGVPVLKVTFPGTNEVDYIHLKQFNPIPKQVYERDEDVDPCIFEGYLENEPEAYAVLTSGCPYENSFQLQFKSKRMVEYLFKVVNGEVEIVKSPFQAIPKDKLEAKIKQIYDEAVLVPETTRQTVTPLRSQTVPPLKLTKGAFPSQGLVLNIATYFDQSFLARFGANSLNKMRAVVAQAQPLYYWPSLTVRVRINVVAEGSISQSILADQPGLDTVGPQVTDPSIHSNVFLCSNNDQPGVVGLAYVGVVCLPDPYQTYKTAIVEYYSDDLTTGQIMAHEVGHNLGMSHDFLNGDPSQTRTDSKGQTCSGVGGVMDYYNSVTLWSTCSVEDFTTYYNSVTPFCMSTDSSSPATTTVATTPVTTTTATTRAPVTTTTTKAPATTTTVTTTKAPTTTTVSAACRCGNFNLVSNPAGRHLDRIVGGFEAPANSIPYQVGIWTLTSGNPFCGGTLISPNYVLTAAHCMVYAASQMRVSVGDVNYQVKGDGEVYYTVATATKHPNYNTANHDFDFALLRLASPVPVSSKANYACLPSDTTQTFVGTNFVISGWGTTSSGGSQSGPLKAAFIAGISNTACSNAGYGSGITSNMICATTNPINTDTCQGDSGGPLVALINGKVTIAGVTSFGIGCAQDPYPGVYSRVTAQKAWILANSDAGNCQN